MKKKINMAKEQQGFGKNNIVNGTFVIRVMIDKSSE